MQQESFGTPTQTVESSGMMIFLNFFFNYMELKVKVYILIIKVNMKST